MRIIALLALFIVAATLLVSLMDGQTDKAKAEASLARARADAKATVIAAQGQARLDTAQAWAVTSASLLPWGVLGIVGTLGLSVVALAVALVNRPAHPQIMERQIILLPAHGQTRAEFWRSLSNSNAVLVSRSDRQGGAR